MNKQNSNYDADYKPYIIGFVLAVILTVIPFAVVMIGKFSIPVTIFVVATAAVIQLVVHLKYFLHLNFVTEEGRLNTFAFLFTAFAVLCMVGLSAWIIYRSQSLMY